MLLILHGDNIKNSRTRLSFLIDRLRHTNLLHLNSKNTNLEILTNFLEGASLFPGRKSLIIDNFFSLHHTIQKKLAPILKQNSQSATIILWQAKNLTPAQKKLFPSAKIQQFKLPNFLWNAINAIKAGRPNQFITNYQKAIDQNLFDLFLYLLKRSLRQQIQTYSRLPQKLLIRTYLKVILLDFANKSGQLHNPKEIVLQKILVDLFKPSA